jgi:hypothetical protein
MQMADVIKKRDIKRLLSRAKQLVNTNKYSAVETVKFLMESEQCSLGEAKEAYTLALNNETLGAYQERVILPQIEELEDGGS